MAGQGQLTIRLFVSSTFEDFAAERRVLQDGLVSPEGDVLAKSPFRELKRRCQSEGAELDIIDLRWGISAAAGRAHLTMERCLAEVDRACSTPGPNFLALIGQRYGWVPVPTQVPADHFAALTEATGRRGEGLLRHWYRREDNMVPEAYVLRDDDQSGLARDEKELRNLFSAARSLLGWDDRPQYGASATEQEMRLALQRCHASGGVDQVLCYVRSLDGLPSGAARYADAGTDAQAAIRRLRDALSPDPAVASREYRVPWADYSAGTATYLAELASDVFGDLAWRLDETIKAARANLELREDTTHADFAAARRRLFRGRVSEQEALRGYLERPAAGPLIVTGPGGVGKSALLAQASVLWRGRAEPLIERYIGISPEASSGRSLAAGIGAGLGTVGADDVFGGLARRLTNQAVFLVVDALDLLGDDDEFLRFQWLPSDWPNRLHVVMSSRDPAHAGRLLRQQPDTLRVNLGPMGLEEAVALFDVFMLDGGRRVTSKQHATATAAIESCPLPLFLRMLAELAARWSARDDVVIDVADLRSIVAYTFDSLSAEQRHGAVMVSAALRLLAASRFGLADGELLDALSCDAEVMASFHARHPDSPDIGYLPDVIWSSLRDDLEPYLSRRAIAGVEVADFFHRELRDTAEERDHRSADPQQTNAQLAATFRRRGTTPEGEWLQESRRAANEIMYHLLEAGDTKRFDELVSRADLLHAAAGQRTFYAGQSTPSPAPVDDLITQLRRRGTDGLAEALSAAGDMLAVRPQAVAQCVQGTGIDVEGPIALAGVGFRRVSALAPIINDHGTKITAALASRDGAFLATGDADGKVAWRPATSCTPVWCQVGHGSWITGLALSPNGGVLASAGDDGSIMLWHLKTGRREQVRPPEALSPNPQASHLTFVDDRHFFALHDGTPIRCDIETGGVTRLTSMTGESYPFSGHMAEPGDHVAFSAGGRWCVESQSGGSWLMATDLVRGVRTLDADLGDTVLSIAVGVDDRVLVSTGNGLFRYELAGSTSPERAPGPVMRSLSAGDTGCVGLDRTALQLVRVDDELHSSVIAQLHAIEGADPSFVRSLAPERVAVCFENGHVEVRVTSDGRTIASNSPLLSLTGGALSLDGKHGLGRFAERTEIVACELDRPPVVKTTSHIRRVVAAADAGNGHLVSVDANGTMIAWQNGEATSTWKTWPAVSAMSEWTGEEGVVLGTSDCRIQLFGPRPAEVDIRSSLPFGRVRVTAVKAAGNPPRVAAVLQSGLVGWAEEGKVSWRPVIKRSTAAGTAVALLPDGAADGRELGAIRLWDEIHEEPRVEWDAHRGAVVWMQAIGPFLASAGAAGTVYVLDTQNLEVIGALHVNGGITTVRVISDSELVVLRRDGNLITYRLEFVS